ncbi:hypothetical protein DFH08DRAFT_816342 [Mycena albidolilacea]|uniref:Uncharacterized protein n=1 Tax=Mycena albidolilacea TaxID=1033008 RepID=A0AAD6ZLL9_9AGAR|nr:hypothetical protein DFH08DRAFT_816342 [Mycena albidolilacea]
MFLALLFSLLSLVALVAFPTAAELGRGPSLDAAAIELPLATVTKMSFTDASALPKTTTTAFMRLSGTALGFADALGLQPQPTPGAFLDLLRRLPLTKFIFQPQQIPAPHTLAQSSAKARLQALSSVHSHSSLGSQHVNKRRKGKGEGKGEDEKAKHTEELIGDLARQGMGISSNLLGP